MRQAAPGAGPNTEVDGGLSQREVGEPDGVEDGPPGRNVTGEKPMLPTGPVRSSAMQGFPGLGVIPTSNNIPAEVAVLLSPPPDL